MEWGGGVIGWQAGSSNYVAHDLSGKSDSNRIGCLYSNSYSAVIYRICKFKRRIIISSLLHNALYIYKQLPVILHQSLPAVIDSAYSVLRPATIRMIVLMAVMSRDVVRI